MILHDHTQVIYRRVADIDGRKGYAVHYRGQVIGHVARSRIDRRAWAFRPACSDPTSAAWILVDTRKITTDHLISYVTGW